MGLFSNNKKLCPICGNATPRLLATKIEGMPICKECDRKVDLPNGMVNQMSLEKFREYMFFYEANQKQRDIFCETYRYNLGFMNGFFLIDSPNRLFRLKDNENALVMEASNLAGFRILEDTDPLYESGNNVLKRYESDVPEKVNAMSAQISDYLMRKREYEMYERMERMREREMERDEGRNGNNPPPPRPYHPRPTFDVPVPVKNFVFEVTFKHPYWGSCRWELGAPTFDRNYPSIENYLHEYKEKVNELHDLAVTLIRLMSPGAQEIFVNGSNPMTRTAPVVPTQAVGSVADEIQKFKELFDAGVITEEEFTAKKRQLLGI